MRDRDISPDVVDPELRRWIIATSPGAGLSILYTEKDEWLWSWLVTWPTRAVGNSRWEALAFFKALWNATVQALLGYSLMQRLRLWWY